MTAPMFLSDQEKARLSVLRVLLSHTDTTMKHVLLTLTAYPAGLTQREMAAKVGLPLPTIREAVTRLRRHKVIGRSHSTRRGSVVWVKVGGAYDRH